MRDHDSDGYVDDFFCPSCGGAIGERGDGDVNHSWNCPWHPSRATAKGGIGNLPASPPVIPPGAGDAAAAFFGFVEDEPNAPDLQPLTGAVRQILSGAQQIVGADVFSATDGGLQ